jgi:hypothetical protein
MITPPQFVTKDSGKAEVFETGATRDSREGKGRFDLISPIALRRIAGVYERGAEKRGEWNWSKGIQFSRLLDSACRHINQFREGDTSEDHIAQAAWNLFAILHFSECKPEMNDLPKFYEDKINPVENEKTWIEKVTSIIKEDGPYITDICTYETGCKCSKCTQYRNKLTCEDVGCRCSENQEVSGVAF